MASLEGWSSTIELHPHECPTTLQDEQGSERTTDDVCLDKRFEFQ